VKDVCEVGKVAITFQWPIQFLKAMRYFSMSKRTATLICNHQTFAILLESLVNSCDLYDRSPSLSTLDDLRVFTPSPIQISMTHSIFETYPLSSSITRHFQSPSNLWSIPLTSTIVIPVSALCNLYDSRQPTH
jgi:hypothetical protein